MNIRTNFGASNINDRRFYVQARNTLPNGDIVIYDEWQRVQPVVVVDGVFYWRDRETDASDGDRL